MVTQAQVSRPRTSLVQAVVKFREVGILVFILVLGAMITLRNPAFLTPENFRDILLNISILIIVALGQSMVIITRGIDRNELPTTADAALIIETIIAPLHFRRLVTHHEVTHGLAARIDLVLKGAQTA